MWVFGPNIKKSLFKVDEVHFDASLKVLQKLHGQKLVEKLIHKQQWLEELNFFSLTQLWRIEEFMSVVSILSSDIRKVSSTPYPFHFHNFNTSWKLHFLSLFKKSDMVLILIKIQLCGWLEVANNWMPSSKGKPLNFM